MAKGKIHIKPKNIGKFNATKKATGKTTEELTHSKNPLTRKRAIFAQNAKKWKHKDGGVSEMGYRDDSPYRNRESIDIHSPEGLIDMSHTSIPLLANGRFLPPNSGLHQFDTNTIREIPLPQAGHGYIVKKSNARKGKTHVVIGPDGTKKYFGDSHLGQHPNNPERKKAFYARHAKNLKNNPYFRAFARKTWEDGGFAPDIQEMNFYNEYAQGGMIKRADGHYSQHGLWDSIRENKGSGKKPTKEMLKQEKKIKAKYETGGKVSNWQIVEDMPMAQKGKFIQPPYYDNRLPSDVTSSYANTTGGTGGTGKGLGTLSDTVNAIGLVGDAISLIPHPHAQAIGYMASLPSTALSIYNKPTDPLSYLGLIPELKNAKRFNLFVNLANLGQDYQEVSGKKFQSGGKISSSWKIIE